VVICYTIFPVLVGNWRTERRLSVNIRASFEGSRARIGDRGSGKRSQRSRLRSRQKAAYCTAEGSSATNSQARGCNGWKALVLVAREARSNLGQGFVQLRTCSRVGRGCYSTKKKYNFRQLSNLDDRQFLAICNLQSAICNLKSQIVLGFHLRPEAF
jgi:hypothetical protein